MASETIIWLIPLPPLLAFFLIVLFTNRQRALSHSIAVGAALLSWLGSMVVFFRALQTEHFGAHPFHDSIQWLPTGFDTWLEIGVRIDPLSAVSIFFVAWTIKSLVLKYGGAQLYRRTLPLFLAMILGQFTCSGLWTIVDQLTGLRSGWLFPLM